MSTAIFFGRSVIKSALSSRAESRDPAKLPLGQLHGIFRLRSTSLRSAQNDGKKNSFRFSHDFHFGLQLDPALFPSDALDIVDQLQYLGRRCGAIVHDPPGNFVKAGSPFFMFFLLEALVMTLAAGAIGMLLSWALTSAIGTLPGSSVSGLA